MSGGGGVVLQVQNTKLSRIFNVYVFVYFFFNLDCVHRGTVYKLYIHYKHTYLISILLFLGNLEKNYWHGKSLSRKFPNLASRKNLPYQVSNHFHRRSYSAICLSVRLGTVDKRESLVPRPLLRSRSCAW